MNIRLFTSNNWLEYYSQIIVEYVRRQHILGAPQFRCPRAGIPSHHHQLKRVYHMHYVVHQRRHHLLSHADVQENQHLEVQMYFKWTGSQHALSQGRFLACTRHKRNYAQSPLHSPIQQTLYCLWKHDGSWDPSAHPFANQLPFQSLCTAIDVLDRSSLPLVISKNFPTTTT